MDSDYGHEKVDWLIDKYPYQFVQDKKTPWFTKNDKIKIECKCGQSFYEAYFTSKKSKQYLVLKMTSK